MSWPRAAGRDADDAALQAELTAAMAANAGGGGACRPDGARAGPSPRACPGGEQRL
jgi:hypothetical protein